MPNKQYSIGEFAAINKISARMLRHYDKIGLFHPDAVLENGYRSYSSGQIPAISLIKKYQSCGFTLAEISHLLCACEEEIAVFAKEKRLELSAQGSQQEKALQQLLVLSGEYVAAIPNDYAMSYTQQPERLLICPAVPVSEGKIEDAFEVLYAALDAALIHPTGLPHLLSHLEAGSASYYAAIPVSQEIHLAGFICRTLSEGWYLSTQHYGSYDDIGAAYDRLLCHAQVQGCQFAPPFLECYFLDCIHTSNPTEYITEISIKITP